MAKRKPGTNFTRRTPISEIRRALKASHGHEVTSIASTEMDIFRELQLLRRATARKLEPLVTRTDPAKAKALLGEYEQKRAHVLDRSESKRAKAISAARGGRRSWASEGHKVGGLFATPGLPFTGAYVTLKPVFIWASQTSGNTRTPIFVNSHADPIGASWAQILLRTARSLPPNGQETFKLTFYYLWWNETDYYVLFNAWADFFFNGTSTVIADTGIFDGGTARVNCNSYLTAIQQWKPPPNNRHTSITGHVFRITADGSGFWSIGDIDGVTLDSVVREVQVPLFSVPPGEAALLEASVFFDCYVDDGSISFDFASVPSYANSIGCHVQLELLTAPSILMAPSP